MEGAVKVFISYAHEDEEHKEKLVKQLHDLIRERHIELWHDRHIEPGADWLAEIRGVVSGCDVAVLMISDDFLDSDFIHSEELGRLLARRNQGVVKIFPIIVRPCRWKRSPISDLQVLPKNGRAVMTFPVENGERDQTWTDVADVFADLVEAVRVTPAGEPSTEDRGTAPDRGAETGMVSLPDIGVSQLEASGDHVLKRHYAEVLRALALGRLVVFLGEEVSHCERGDGKQWAPGLLESPPRGTELARHLASSYACPSETGRDLARVAQYVAVKDGSAPLYADLHDVYDADYPCTAVHRALAALPMRLRHMGVARPCPLIITVNFDDLMERAYREAGEDFDVLCYMAEDQHRGRFMHADHEGESRIIDRPNEYAGLAVDDRPVVLKLQGTVDRGDGNRDSFVITEDDHIGYVTGTDLASLLPATLVTRLLRSHFLFLGHSLRDWNLRVIMQRIFGGGRLRSRSWAVRPQFDDLDRELWAYRNVTVIEHELVDYAAGLERCVESLAAGAEERAAP